MNKLFSCIEDDAQEAMNLMKLDILDVRIKRGTKTITDKRAMLYCHLYLYHTYSYEEIATYCHKDSSSLIRTVNKYKDMYVKEAQDILINTQELTHDTEQEW
jgi:hypothetical protein